MTNPPTSNVGAARGLRTPPGPRSWSPLGNIREFAGDVLGFHGRMRDAYGPIVRIRLANRVVYLITDPALIHEVLVTHHRDFVKHSFFWRNVTAIFGHGLLTNDGDSWLRQRRLAAPAFHRDRIAEYAEHMVAYSERMLARWRDGDVRDAHTDMMGLTLEIVAKVLFNTEIEPDVEAVGHAFDAVTDEIAKRFRRPVFVPDWVPLPGNLRYRRGVAALNAIVYRIIREHHANGASGSDLLSMLMQARDENGERMSDEQLRDEAVTLLLAGHETTALVLSWTWYLLSRHPEVESRLHEELDRVLQGRPPSVTDLPALRYTEQVILESMRLHPPAYAFGREAIRDIDLGGYDVKKGTTLLMSVYTMHRDPRWFDDPLAFRPERWADGLADRLPRHVYMPFGGGPRICIGNGFAMMEATLLLAAIARRFRLRAVSSGSIVPFPTITLRPIGGVPMRLHGRQPDAVAET